MDCGVAKVYELFTVLHNTLLHIKIFKHQHGGDLSCYTKKQTNP